MGAPSVAATQPGSFPHKRTPSAVLKSIVTSRGSKAQPAPTPAASPSKTNGKSYATRAATKAVLTLPPDHPDSSHMPLGEINNLQYRSPQKFQSSMTHEEPKAASKSLHKKTKSAISLKSLTGKDKVKAPKEAAAAGDHKPKKSKSSTSLSALLMRPKSSKGTKQESEVKDKENHTPPQTAQAAPPIWAQFATPRTEEVTRTTRVPLNDSWNVSDEVARYTPQEYSPSKGRNFGNYQPTLSKKPQLKQRPASAFVSTPVQSMFFTGQGSDASSNASNGTKTQKTANDRPKTLSKSRTDYEHMASPSRGVSGITRSSHRPVDSGSRVMTAVAAFDGRTHAQTAPTPTPQPERRLDPVAIQAAFEAVLETRNIAADVREKMRGLDTNLKAEFVKQQSKIASSSAEGDQSSSHLQSAIKQRADAGNNDSLEGNQSASPKKSRPRSLTFTLSKGDASPQKKQKSGRPDSHTRNKSVDIPRSASSKSLNAAMNSSALSQFGRSQKPATPETYISHLRKAEKPQLVEVGKLQKLRQLLRNETVSWVEDFVAKGGMAEMVGLLYRIIGIEWREEHDDMLLHNTLNCLKALLTTASALEYLSKIQNVLFPTLINLLFSSGEARRGPSEYTTRTLIISLLFSYLQGAPTPNQEERAKILLSYLRDPIPADSERPPGWIVDMRRPRPYKLWETELYSVTKEVFWIFLHHVNIIPFPNNNNHNNNYDANLTADDPSATYLATHFPTPRAPVPAAPHVGGIEWDATVYLATHLDLLNGLVASLPTQGARWALRGELRDSGFEKVLGNMRTCKEKFYGAVHEALSTWVGAARDDGWAYRDVKEGPPREELRSSRSKSRSPAKKNNNNKNDAGPPVLGEVKVGGVGGGKFDFGLELGSSGGGGGGGGGGLMMMMGGADDKWI